MVEKKNTMVNVGGPSVLVSVATVDSYCSCWLLQAKGLWASSNSDSDFACARVCLCDHQGGLPPCCYCGCLTSHCDVGLLPVQPGRASAEIKVTSTSCLWLPVPPLAVKALWPTCFQHSVCHQQNQGVDCLPSGLVTSRSACCPAEKVAESFRLSAQHPAGFEPR